MFTDAGFQNALLFLNVFSGVLCGLRLLDCVRLALHKQAGRHVVLFFSNYVAFLAVGTSMLGTTTLQAYYGDVPAVSMLFYLASYTALTVFAETVYYEFRNYTRAEQRSLHKGGLGFLVMVVLSILVGAVVIHSLCLTASSAFTGSSDQLVDASAVVLTSINTLCIVICAGFVLHWCLRWWWKAFDNSMVPHVLSFAGKAALMLASSLAAASLLPGSSIVGSTSDLPMLQWVAWGLDFAFVVAVFVVEAARSGEKYPSI